MGNKCGDAVSITLNGTKFAIPKDVEPIVNKGGQRITETQGYGDGTADGYFSVITPGITGLKVKINDSNRAAFEAACGLASMPIVYETIGSSFELTGCIVGDFGISSTKKISDEFAVSVTDGSGIRES